MPTDSHIELSEKNLELVLRALEPDHLDYILSDKVMDISFDVAEKLSVPNEHRLLWGKIIGFYLAGKIPDNELEKVITTELAIEPELGKTYADAIISAFESDRELEEKQPQPTEKGPTLADELLHVARSGQKTEEKTTPTPTVPSELPKPTETKINIPLVPIYTPAQKGVPQRNNLPTNQNQTNDPQPTPSHTGLVGQTTSAPKTLDSEIMSHFTKPQTTPPPSNPALDVSERPRIPTADSSLPVMRTPQGDKDRLHLAQNPLPPVFKEPPSAIPQNTPSAPDPAQKPAPAIEEANKKSAVAYGGGDPYREPIA